MSWVKLMLVCKRWHEIGFNAPQLWRVVIVTRNLEALRFRLERTGTIAFDLVVHHSDAECNHAALPLILPHLPRLRSISASVPLPAKVLSVVKTILNETLPMLREVAIKYSPRISEHPDRVLRYQPDIGITPARHPRLCRVESFGIALPSAHIFWSGLSSLRVGIPIDSTYPENIVKVANDFVSLLRHCSRLRHLHVVVDTLPYSLHQMMVHPGIPSADRNNAHPAHLLALTEIDFTGPYAFAALMMRSFKCGPAMTSFRVSTDIDGSAAATALLQPLSGARRAWLPSNPTRSGRTELRLFLSPALGPAWGENHPAALHRCSVTLSTSHHLWQREAASGSQVLVEVCGAFALEELVVGDSAPLERDSWTHVFTAFPALRVLRFTRGPSIKSAFTALDALAADESIAPALEHLYLTLRELTSTLEAHDFIEAIRDVCRARARLAALTLRLPRTGLVYPTYVERIGHRVHRAALLELNRCCGCVTWELEGETIEALWDDAEGVEKQRRSSAHSGVLVNTRPTDASKPRPKAA
ncbi:uncharacterized protein BXZ73DRAFT_107754 [Epithele typhae]|uniref:uncharacterized protein n=1 Tax=Epithele typhae TaxID=378194 RepID=UPI0020082736|nr:uncharacterized protein BXZ73DRAFT_107754 [Epithele typhae]KAH9911922.1 hypothetical protein BXZ73DRAFT_107754 [Epithele typhae]